MSFRKFLATTGIAIAAAAASMGAPLSATFTYQGQLVLNGDVVDGTADLRFQLYNAAVGGVAVGLQSDHLAQPVDGGLFTIDGVNVGADTFDGTELWMEISARVPAGVGAWVTLSPRQRVAAAPYAIHSMRPWITDGNDIYFDGTFVGIGTNNPGYRLHVQSTTPRAIFGICTNPTGNTTGVFGQSDSDAGEGVTGFATAATGTTSGVYGISSSTSGRGVTGTATNGNGTNFGVYGEANGPSGAGVFGLADSAQPLASADGVRGQSDTTFGAGVHGIANSPTGNTYGVRGSVASANGYAGYFEGRGRFTGRVGIGPVPALEGPLTRLHVVTNAIPVADTAVPGDDLVVEDTDGRINIFSSPSGDGGSAIALSEADTTFGGLVNKWTMIRETATGGQGNGLRFSFGTSVDPFSNPTRVYFADDGNVGIGTLTPTNRLAVSGSANITGNLGVGTTTPDLKLHVVGGSDAELNTGGYMQLGDTPNANLVLDQNEIMARSNGAAADLFLNFEGGDVILAPQGNTRVRVLEITGADLAEKFPASEELKPGMVTAIDPANPGKLCLARGSYNRGVAGVVSGANNFSVGAVLGNLPGHEDAPPIALSGRVYVYCDATEYAIEPTDLLTTSDTPGHAMKVNDHAKAQGAVLGKAMTGLAKGEKGMVLVLVNLQ